MAEINLCELLFNSDTEEFYKEYVHADTAEQEKTETNFLNQVANNIIGNAISQPKNNSNYESFLDLILDMANSSWNKEKLLYKEFMSEEQPEKPNWIIAAENAKENTSNNIGKFSPFGIPIDNIYTFLMSQEYKNIAEKVLKYISTKQFINDFTGKALDSFQQKTMALKKGTTEKSKITVLRASSNTANSTIFTSTNDMNIIQSFFTDNILQPYTKQFVDEAIELIEKRVLNAIGLKPDYNDFKDNEYYNYLYTFFQKEYYNWMNSFSDRRKTYRLEEYTYMASKNKKVTVKAIDSDTIYKEIIKQFKETCNFIEEGDVDGELKLPFLPRWNEQLGLQKDEQYYLKIVLKKSSTIYITTNYNYDKNKISKTEVNYLNVSNINNISDLSNAIIEIIKQHFENGVTFTETNNRIRTNIEINKDDAVDDFLDALKAPLENVLKSHKPNSINISTYISQLFGESDQENRATTIQGTIGEIIGAAILKLRLGEKGEVSILGQSKNQLKQQAHADILVKIGNEKIGIQAKQYNSSGIFNIQYLYADDYNVFEDSIFRYIEDKDIVKYIRYLSFQYLSKGTEPNIDSYLLNSYLYFSRIKDLKADDILKNVDNNFFMYNFTLIPTSLILCNIILNLLSELKKNSNKKIFNLEKPYVKLDKNKKKKVEKEDGTIGESEDAELLTAIKYNDELETKYLVNGKQWRTLKGNINFVGLTLSLKNITY